MSIETKRILILAVIIVLMCAMSMNQTDTIFEQKETIKRQQEVIRMQEKAIKNIAEDFSIEQEWSRLQSEELKRHKISHVLVSEEFMQKKIKDKQINNRWGATWGEEK